MLNQADPNFLNLLTRSFGASASDDVFEEVKGRFATVESDTDFDLFLWSVAHRFKIDTEELARQLGERWALDRQLQMPSGVEGAMEPMLQALDWLISDAEELARAPMVGMESFRIAVLSRGQKSMRICCFGARRCCSFVEGVARGLGRLSGETLRYIRQPQGGAKVEIKFQVVGESES